MGWVLKFSDIKHRLLMITGISVVIVGLLLLFDVLPFRQTVAFTRDGVILDSTTHELVSEASLRFEGKMDFNFFLEESYTGSVTVKNLTSGEQMHIMEVKLKHQRAGDAWVLGGGYVVNAEPRVLFINTDKAMDCFWMLLDDPGFVGQEFVSHAKTADEAMTVKTELINGN